LQEKHNAFGGLPMKAYVGKYGRLDIFLITNGKDKTHKVPNIGTQPATLSTYVGINHFNPDLVISIGTAGGISENGASIGHVYASHTIYFIDRRMPIPGYQEYGLGGYESFDVATLSRESFLKRGVICSGDSFDNNETDFAIALKAGCIAKDMEAGAVAWVSMINKVPMVAIKGITDIVGSKSGHDEFNQNTPAIMDTLVEKLHELLDHIQSK
jgi:nucleoside phosphorylase